jgi:uncharacterized protein YqjF (DUF2071 family)
MNILDETAHRPWPLPKGPWLMRQTWNDLLFAHWPVDRAALRPLVPATFAIDEFDGQAWVAVVPFYMTDVAPRLVPPLPWVSAFPELNVRTYVTVDGKPGVYFFSLDAGNPIAVGAARTLLSLPYYSAQMSVENRGGEVHYRSRRAGPPPAEFEAVYHGLDDRYPAMPRTLEHFLTERYCLYALNHRSIPYRLQIHHLPWALESAQATIAKNTVADVAGIRLPAILPMLHFSKRQEMVCWAPETLDA